MKLHHNNQRGITRIKDYWIYTAKNEGQYIQTYDSCLAHAIRYLTGIKFYKITIQDKVIHSFIYTNELLDLFNKLEKMKNTSV